MQEPEKGKLSVSALSPFKSYYEGQAEIVSAINRIGPFDVLPGHTGFFSILEPGEIVIETGTDQIAFSISNGFISVRDDTVEVFVNI
jgi:F-type H+-transporting ATPase subunit epsilon